MASEHFTVPQNTDLGMAIRSAVITLQSAVEQVSKVYTALETRRDGTDYSRIETDLGISTGSGSDIHVMFAGTNNALHGIGATSDDVAYAVGKLVETLRRCGI